MHVVSPRQVGPGTCAVRRGRVQQIDGDAPQFLGADEYNNPDQQSIPAQYQYLT
ncbi:MAG: hypothetical protein PUP92_05485 [Rhizonema sp. PD38]|nr:hypothetical protein [Rhizonema sp. PD38]